MAVSLLNVMIARDVEKLLQHDGMNDMPDAERCLKKEQVGAIIHAALWAYACRSGDTAAAYAMMSLFDAIGLETWKFKKRPSQETSPECHASIKHDGSYGPVTCGVCKMPIPASNRGANDA